MSVQVIAYEIFKNSDIKIDTEWQDYPELNSEELTMLIDHFVDTSYKLNLFDEENAKKIPGSLEFLKIAQSYGIKIFYVTNRAAEYETATRNNLKKLN